MVVSLVPQQTGVLFKSRQQQQPAEQSVLRQSQQDWIISQHFWSPLVQVTQQPSLVSSHLHKPIVRLQLDTIMPLSVQ